MKNSVTFLYDQKDKEKKNMKKDQEYKIIREYKGEFSVEELLDKIIRSHANEK